MSATIPVPALVLAFWPSDGRLVTIRWWHQTFLPFVNWRAVALHESEPVRAILLPSLHGWIIINILHVYHHVTTVWSTLWCNNVLTTEAWNILPIQICTSLKFHVVLYTWDRITRSITVPGNPSIWFCYPLSTTVNTEVTAIPEDPCREYSPGTLCCTQGMRQAWSEVERRLILSVRGQLWRRSWDFWAQSSSRNRRFHPGRMRSHRAQQALPSWERPGSPCPVGSLVFHPCASLSNKSNPT